MVKRIMALFLGCMALLVVVGFGAGDAWAGKPQYTEEDLRRQCRDKREILKRTNLRLEKIRVLLRICHEEKFLSHDAFKFAIKGVDETGRMLGGWVKQQEGKRDANI
ncbi:MAG: four helix bundle protein [Magnetococcus sp. DMHC-1]